MQSLQWPLPRVDGAALLVAGAPRAARRPPSPAPPRAEPPGLMREISKLSSFRLRRAARCSYSVLGERDSTESLASAPALAKSQSSYALPRRQPPAGDASPREADEAERLAREPVSVPEFADMVLPAPARLVCFDSDEEAPRRAPLRKSASVRFTCDSATVSTEAGTEDEAELSTSDYASAERVAGFSNPHYLGPDVRGLGAALTPDSGVAPGDIELRELRAPRPPPARQLHLLLVGGKEAAHPLLQRPLSLWTYRLL